MKKFDITLTGHYEKTISVYADSPEQAVKRVDMILFDTDLIDFSDEDFVGGEVDIQDAGEDDSCDTADEKEACENGCCSGCWYRCPVCGECMYEDED